MEEAPTTVESMTVYIRTLFTNNVLPSRYWINVWRTPQYFLYEPADYWILNDIDIHPLPHMLLSMHIIQNMFPNM